MWNKLSQAAGLTSAEIEDEKEEKSVPSIDEEQLQHQELLIKQLKELVRENEKRFQDKTKEYDELSSKFQKFKLQTKAKISHLSSQIKEQEKTAKKEDCDFDDTSSSDSSDQSRRGKVLLLKRQLDQVKHQLDKKEEESKKLIDGYERRINDLTLQLNEKNSLISSLADAGSKEKSDETSPEQSPKKESNIQEMYAQMVYKDTKIMGLNNQILELEKQIIDLQEHIKDKDEVLQQRNRAVQLMAEDLNRKGQTVVNELGDTREQMKIMQENFSTAENEWKLDLQKYKERISELENDVMEFNKKLKNNETVVKNLENARSELMTKNAELQKKIVVVQESASKQCELYNKEIGAEVESMKSSLESEKQRSAELQKALDESSTQSNNKVLKARVNERTKFKALERELNELKKEHQNKPQQILELQERIAELEEEKGSLQLKLMDIEDQIIQLEKLKEENSSLKISVEKGLGEIQNLEEQIKTLVVERNNSEIKFNSFNESYKDLEDKHNSTNLEKVKLQEEISSLIKYKEKLENDNNELEKECSAVKKMYNDSLQALEQLKNQKVAFELKSIELEEIRENDDEIKKDLLSRIQQFEDSFRDESKPDIQLEKENLELKDKLRQLNNQYNEVVEKNEALSVQIENFQKKLFDDEKEYSSEIDRLNLKIKDMEISHEEMLNNLKSKVNESIEQSNLIKELESSFSSVQNDLSNICSYFGAKDVNDCKNYAIKKAEEYSHLKSDYEKAMKEKDNLLLNLTGKDGEIQKYCSKIEEFTSALEQQDNQSQSLKKAIEDLKNTILEKDSFISQISSELQQKVASEKSLLQTLQEKSESLMNSVEQEKNTSQELESAKEALETYKEKVLANNSSLLGQISEMENEVDSLREELSSKTSIVANLNTSLQNIQKESNVIKEKLKEKGKIIKEKNKTITSLESDVKSTNDSLSSLSSENKSLRDTEAAKDTEILLLGKKIEECNKVIKTKEDELSKSNYDLQQIVETVTKLEESTRLLKEKNTMLEEEKLHSNRSISEKDEIHQQVLSEKLHLELEVSKFREENNSLQNSLREKEDKLVFIDGTLIKMFDLLEKDDSTVQEFFLEVSSKDNNLLNFAQKNFDVIAKSQRSIQTLSIENSSLLNEIGEAHATVEKQLEELKNSNLIINKLEKKCEEYSGKVSAFQMDLVATNDVKLKLDKQINKLNNTILKLNEENRSLNKSISSSQEEYATQMSSLHKDFSTCQEDIQIARDKINMQEEEKLKLEELCNSLNVSMTNSELKIEKFKNEVKSLNEMLVLQENKLSELNQLVENYKKEIDSLQNEVAECNVKFCEERTVSEQVLKNAATESEKLKGIVTELESRVLEYQNINLSNENATTDLQSLLSNKDNQISDLRQQVNTLTEENAKLQTSINDNKEYEQSVESKLEFLRICKQHYFMVLQGLLRSYQVNLDVSFLESDDISNQSMNKFIQESKIVEIIDKHASEYQSLCTLHNDLKKDMESLKTMNSNVYYECDTLKNQLIELIKNNMKQNDSKFHTIFTSFQDKESSLLRLKSKISTLNDSVVEQKNHISSLESDRNIYLKELETTKEYLEKSKRTIEVLNDEKEVISQNLQSVTQVYEAKISELEAFGKEMSSKSDSLGKDLSQKQSDIEKYMKQIQEFEISMNTKNDTISKILEEQKSNANILISKSLELENAHTSIVSLQNEIKNLNKQLNEYTESQVLETANNVSNGLQLEVERLRSDLEFCEEQKHSLQQHIDNTNAQLQSMISEKSDIEMRMSEMEHKLNDLTEYNLKLNNAVKESNSSLHQYEQRCTELQDMLSKYKDLHEAELEEIEVLKTEKMEYELKGKKDILDKITILEESCNSFKDVIKKMLKSVSENGFFDCDFKSLAVDLKDESLIMLFSELSSKLEEMRSAYKKEKENFTAEINVLKSQNREISEDLEKVKEFHQKDKNDDIKDRTSIAEISIVPASDEIQSLNKEILQTQEPTLSLCSADTFSALESENKSIRQEMTECKAKFTKSLDKLKLFKVKNDKLNGELKEFKEKCTKLETVMSESIEKERELLNKLAMLENEKEQISSLQSINKQIQKELEKSKEAILQLRQRNSLLDDECCKVRQELEEYKHSWNESNVSYELQKEDNERLRIKTNNLSEQIDSSKTKISELNNQLMQAQSEAMHLKEEAENLKEHANMLLSDNDTYQGLIERLKTSKSSLEQKLFETKEKFSEKFKALQNEHKFELEKLKLEQTENNTYNTFEFENECIVLRNQITELQQLTDTLQSERDVYLRNQNLLEKEKIYLQQQLLESTDELQKTKSKLDCKGLDPLPDYGDEQSTKMIVEINKLKDENENYKSQFANLVQELNVTKENFLYLQNDCFSKETYYMDKVNQLETQLHQHTKSAEKEISDAQRMEGELSQAMNSLHKQGLRCEELSLEVSKLLEERNMLKWQLQQSSHLNAGIKTELNEESNSTSDLMSIKIESPSSSNDIATLHVRLVESEKTCQQLRQANDALDRALNIERDQKRFIEEELGYAKEHLTEEAKASDEYQILLGEINEPEMFAETNFAISRNVRTHAYKFRRWLRGRRNYLWRTVRSRNYPQLVYIFYICFIHIWLMACVFS